MWFVQCKGQERKYILILKSDQTGIVYSTVWCTVQCTEQCTVHGTGESSVHFRYVGCPDTCSVGTSKAMKTKCR